MKKLNNKGVALVTVLITMTFATILATSLIYMAYMNYAMKSMRYSSTDNFYTAEFALDDLTMAMQQLASEKGSAADAVAALLGSAEGVGAYTNGNNKQQYNNECVRAMIQVATREATISVNTVYEQNANGTISSNVISTGNSVELKGLEITSITDSGYKSTIVTDLKIVFPSSSLGDLDINDFSVLTDSPVVVEAGNCYFTGCVFIGDGTPGSVANALTIKGGSTVHILSPRGVINGNISVESGATLVITGTVSVVGKINLASDATLICTDALQVKEGVIGGHVRGADRNAIKNATMNAEGIPDALLEQLIVPVHMYYSGHWHEVTLQNLVDAWTWKKGTANEGSTEVNVYFGLENTTNGLSHNLVLSPSPVTIKMAMSDSTIIANGGITIGQAGSAKSTIMQRLSDEEYELAKSSFLGILQEQGYYGPGNNIKFPSSGKAPDDIPESAAHEKEVDIRVTSNPAYHYTVTYKCGSNADSNYVSVGNFINEKSSKILTDIFGSAQGEAAASTSIISIYNWSKE